MIVEDPRRGITEMDRVRSLATAWTLMRSGWQFDGDAVVRAIVKELESAGGRMPESTKFVLRSTAAAVLLLTEQPK